MSLCRAGLGEHLRWHYQYAGLSVCSELVLPEWAAFESVRPQDDPDVLIRLE